MKMRENEEWVEQHFGQCELGNRLRTERLVSIAGAMIRCPEKSLPKQNPNWADLKAAYRLFDNLHVTFDAVAEPHWKQTRQSKPGRYLLISDTTDLNHISHPATTGLGMLGNGSGRGMQLHSCLVYNCDTRLISGTAGAIVHYRNFVPKNETRMQRLKRIRESELWGKLVEKAGSPPCGSHWIHVFDRGGDNFEAMCHIRQTGCDWIIRGAKLQRNVILDSGSKLPLKEAIDCAESIGSYDLKLRSRPGVQARTAKLTISTLKVALPRPRPCSEWVKQCGIKELGMNVVIVEEKRPSKTTEPIRWVLFTSLPINSFDDAKNVIEDYEKRWLIEEYHKVLKSGCSIEKHALRTADRLEPLIALITILGTRLLQLKLVGRNQKQAKAKTHIPSDWLKALKLVHPKTKLTNMTVYEFFRELAKLGGFLGRKGDGEPGWETTWHGFQKLKSLLDGMRLTGAF